MIPALLALSHSSVYWRLFTFGAYRDYCYKTAAKGILATPFAGSGHEWRGSTGQLRKLYQFLVFHSHYLKV